MGELGNAEHNVESSLRSLGKTFAHEKLFSHIPQTSISHYPIHTSAHPSAGSRAFADFFGQRWYRLMPCQGRLQTSGSSLKQDHSFLINEGVAPSCKSNEALSQIILSLIPSYRLSSLLVMAVH